MYGHVKVWKWISIIIFSNFNQDLNCYGGAILYNRTEIILEAYPYEFTDIQKGRGAYICIDSAGEKKILKEFSGSEAKADLLDLFLQYLKGQGIVAEQIVHTKEGHALFTDIDEARYYMRTWRDGRECDVRNRDDVLCAVRKLAKFHCVSAGFTDQMPDPLCKTDDSLKLQYERHMKELRKVRNYIKSRKKKNEFEARFLKEYSYYYDQAKEAIGGGLENGFQQRKERYFGVCHGDFNQHNLLFTPQGAVIINYERFCKDAYVSDCAHFFRKILEKHNWNVGIGMDMVNAYDKVRRLEGWEMGQLYLRMAFPEKFWKVANHYFNSKKSWANNRDSEKLEKICAQEQERSEFLKLLKNFVKE